MPVPMAKIVVSVMRTLAWPVVSVITRRVKKNPMTKTYNFYYLAGIKAYQFEDWI